MIRPAPGLAPLALALAACSQAEDTQQSAGSPAATATPRAAPATPAATVGPSADTLTPEGLGDLVVGKPVPADSSFKLREAQASDSCLIYSSPAHLGVYAIVEGGTLRRVTVGRGSRIKLVEGIGIGATEKEVLAAFPGFKSDPHTYVAAPAKYLTQPENDPRLRFEIGEDGRVTDIHVGLVPQLLYVEGCA